MKITPLGNAIQLEIKEATAGVLDTSSRESAVELATVVAVGSEVFAKSLLSSAKSLVPMVGDNVFVKAWAIDIVTHEDKKYYFCNLDTNGVLAIVK